MTSPADSPAERWWSNWWARLKRPLTWLFFGLVAWLLYTQARGIHWREVGVSLTAIPLRDLALAIGLAMLGHGIYACYDLLSRWYVGFDLGTARVMVTTFVSYAFNLNLGALVGGLGFRYRLYSRQGLDDGQITRTIAFSMWTNWFGYFVLAGCCSCCARSRFRQTGRWPARRNDWSVRYCWRCRAAIWQPALWRADAGGRSGVAASRCHRFGSR